MGSMDETLHSLDSLENAWDHGIRFTRQMPSLTLYLVFTTRE